MKIRLHMVKALKDHTPTELNSLQKRTIREEAGSSSMYNEIQNVRMNFIGGKELIVYHFRNSNNADVGWVALVKITEFGIRDELWTFVVSKYRRKGIGTQMIDIVEKSMSPQQKNIHYRVYGFHSAKAEAFYTKNIKQRKDSLSMSFS